MGSTTQLKIKLKLEMLSVYSPLGVIVSPLSEYLSNAVIGASLYLANVTELSVATGKLSAPAVQIHRS